MSGLDLQDLEDPKKPKDPQADLPKKPQNVHLDRRLRAAASFVRLDKRIADVGTDHAFIPCFLFQQGARALFACDILEGPLSAARATMELYGIPEKKVGSGNDDTEGISLFLCDGLDGVPETDDVIIAGMGGEMIADIISRCKYINEDMHFILQPMTRDWFLRKELYKTGLYIEEEKTAVVGSKVYTIMLCCYDGVKREIDDKFAFIGKNVDKEYLNKVTATLEKMSRGDKKYADILAQLT
ncbi:MAG: class I SAM-dependent methyltransferase [Ruminiclostridium sp.]|nr:class I SAM-dependent methyltransferase [Ruminiclostridium sp.]